MASILVWGICNKLHCIRKASNQKVTEILNKFKSLYDNLSIGTWILIDDLEIINTASDGLMLEFDSFVTSLHVRERTTFAQFYQQAVQEERHLKKHNEFQALNQMLSHICSTINKVQELSRPKHRSLQE